MARAIPDLYGAPPNPFGENPDYFGGMRQGMGHPATSGLAPPPPPPAPNYGAPVKFSPTTRQVSVNGNVFDADDAQTALRSNEFLRAPPKPAPEGDWYDVEPDEFQGYIQGIRNPGLKKLAARNFDIGTHNLQLLAGRGAQFVGAEDTGQKWVNSALEELRKNEPYQRQFTDIDLGSESNGAVDWFVANLAQQGPNLIESVVTALGGAVVGGAVGGGANPFTAVGGAVAATMGKTAYKQALLNAAKKHAKGEALSSGESKLLREATGLTAAAIKAGKLDDAALSGLRRGGKRQAQAGGAALATGASNYALGVSDIYGESIEQGEPDRLTAALGGVPYAALESMPEFLLAGRFFGSVPKAITKGGVLRRGAVGAGIGGLAEGATELGQESLLLGLTDQFGTTDPQEISKRLINSFAAGFAIGSPIGGGVNALRRGSPTDLLDSGSAAEPTSTAQTVTPHEPSGALTPDESESIPMSLRDQLGPLPRDMRLRRGEQTAREVEGLGPVTLEPTPQTPQPSVAEQLGPLPDNLQAAEPGAGVRQQVEAAQLDPASIQLRLAEQQAAAEPASVARRGRELLARGERQTQRPSPLQRRAVSEDQEPSPVGLGAGEPAGGVQRLDTGAVAGRTGEPAGQSAAGLRRGAQGAQAGGSTTPQTEASIRKNQSKPDQVARFISANHAWSTMREWKDSIVPKMVNLSDFSDAMRQEWAVAYGAYQQSQDPDALLGQMNTMYGMAKINGDLDRKGGKLTGERKLNAAMATFMDADGRSDELMDDAALFIAEVAFSSNDNWNKTTKTRSKTLRSIADNFIKRNESEFSPNQTHWMTEAWANVVNQSETISATTKTRKSGAPRTVRRPWFNFADRHNLWDRVTATITHRPQGFKLPEERIATQTEGAIPERGTTVNIGGTTYPVRDEDVAPGEVTRITDEDKLAEIGAQYENISRGSQPDEIRDVITDTAEFLSQIDENGNTYVDPQGNPISGKVSHIKIRSIINRVTRGLKVRPKVHVFEDVNDLRERNPTLHERASKGRPAGDFDTLPIVGYSIGDQVIIFSDRARSEQQVKFVVAHEILGHFGLRALMDPKKLNASLNYVYDSDPFLRFKVAVRMESGVSKLEAIEEVLADYAGALDVNVLSRAWAAVKSGLNRLGIRFDDDAARYLLSRARANLKNPGEGNPVNAQAIYDNLKRLAASSEYGRTALDSTADNMAQTTFAMYGMNRRVGEFGLFQGVRNLFTKGSSLRTLKDMRNVLGEVAETVQTFSNVSTRSEGLRDIFNLTQTEAAMVRSIQSHAASLSEFTHRSRIKWWQKDGKTDGPSQEELRQGGELAAIIALHKQGTITDKMLDGVGNLVGVSETGEVNVDVNTLDRLQELARVDRAQLANGLEIKRETDKEGEKGQVYKFDFKITDRVWKIAEEIRESIDYVAQERVKASFASALDQKAEAINGFKNAVGRDGDRPTSLEIQALKTLTDKYRELYTVNSTIENGSTVYDQEAQAKAESFVRNINRAMWKREKLLEWEQTFEPSMGIEEFFDDPDYPQIVESLRRLNALKLGESQAYKLTEAMRDLILMDPQLKSAETLAKSTIGKAYVPFTRRGKWQVVLKAYDEDGKSIKLDPTVQGILPYFQTEYAEEGHGIMGELNEAFGDKLRSVKGADGNTVKVRIRAEQSKTRQSRPITSNVSVHEFMNMATKLGLKVSPEDRAKVIKALTNENSRLRRNLHRTGVAGWDPNVVRSVSEYLETTAHVAGKQRYRHVLNRIMLDNTRWFGSADKLKAKARAIEEAQNPEERFIAEQSYAEYAYMYSYMAPKGARQAELNGKKLENRGRGADYLERAKRFVEWYSQNDNILHSTEDILSGEVSSRLKMAAVIMQLGMSVKTAMLNMFALNINVIPYLATYNGGKGFGGGHGWRKSTNSVVLASKNLKDPKLANAEFLAEVAENAKLQDQYGLTEGEAEFLRDVTAEGVLQAAQFNALIGSARGGVHNNTVATGIQSWMYMFTYTEQFTRRVAALASWRMEYQRALAAGMSNTDAEQYAREKAVRAVNTSIGEYSMYNRPEMARGNVLQYIFMYKTYPIVTLEMFGKMAKKEQLAFLGMLWLMAGVKGLPFAEDLMDILDTLAQKLGLPMSSVEHEAAKFVDWVAPGMTPLVMRGLIDQTMGVTASTSLSFGNNIPLTGLFKAGSEPVRELKDFAGPVFSGVVGLGATAWSLGEYSAEVVGLKPDTTSLASIAREAPVAFARSLFDSVSYAQDGKLTNAHGKVLSNEAGYHEIIGRFLGFYPEVATRHYDMVALSKEMAEHHKIIASGFVEAAVKARVSGDTKRLQQVNKMVREWNKDHGGTPYHIPQFGRKVSRAYRTARQPTANRYLRTAPRAIRSYANDLADIYGIE